MTTGRISSFQSMGAVDGPGLRCVVFMQGCPLRCAYCHNPETWELSGGQETTAEELCARIERFAAYIKHGGGVTASGGEPMCQSDFVAELFSLLHQKGYHTALDTSGAYGASGAENILDNTDLVICDMKFTDAAIFEKYCGGRLEKVFEFLDAVSEKKIPLWLRQVIVPGVNDTEESILALKKVASRYPTLEKIELLPFRKICRGKYENLGLDFPFDKYSECKKDTIERLQTIVNSD